MGDSVRCTKCGYRFEVGYPGRGLAYEARDRGLPIDRVVEEYFRRAEKRGARVYRMEPEVCPKCGADKKNFETVGYFD